MSNLISASTGHVGTTRFGHISRNISISQYSRNWDRFFERDAKILEKNIFLNKSRMKILSGLPLGQNL